MNLFVIRTFGVDAAVLTVNDAYVRYLDPRDDQTDELIRDIVAAVDRWNPGTEIVRYNLPETLERLNAFTGNDVWTEHIMDLAVYSPGKTDNLPGFFGERAFTAIDGLIIAKHPDTETWTALTPGTAALADFTATLAHEGQVDKAGVRYIEHPRAVAAKVATHPVHYTTVALLHDTVEDTALDLIDLKNLGFTQTVIDAVDAVTRRDNETYMDFVRRAAAHPVGRVVKLADNAHNTERLGNLPADIAERMGRRYARARKILEAAA